MTRRTVEVLYFEGCPNVDLTLARAQEALAAAKLEDRAAIVRTAVQDDDDAQRKRFLGSPSVRVDGRDVEPAAGGREDFGIQCRVYPTERGMEHAPPVAWIVAALAGEPAAE
jgi:hypothetical protein